MSPIVSIVLGIAAALAAVVGLLYWLGKKLGPDYEVSRTLRLKARPEGVWTLLTDVGTYGSWWPRVAPDGVVMIDEPDDRDAAEKRIRVFFGKKPKKPGARAVSCVVRTAVVRPIRGSGPEEAGLIEQTLAWDQRKNVGRLVYRVSREAAGTTRVFVTETVTGNRPIMRAVRHYVQGDDAGLRNHLTALATHLGEEARVEE